jgi:ribonuclease Z
VAIWISHIHGDHHFGLYELLHTRAKLSQTPIPLVCQQVIADHMTAIQEVAGMGSLFFRHLTHENPFQSGNLRITSIPVKHYLDSYGCVCDLDGGYRLAFSGDRTIDDEFAKGVGSCDLMIHEATFTDDMEETALAKCHSTVGQAVRTGKEANAKYLILTHFSQRYPKVPAFEEGSDNVTFAFDYLSFRYEDMEDLCKIGPKVLEMLVEKESRDEDDD